MGYLFVNITLDAYSTSVIVVPYEKSCCVGPPYNRTRLYYVLLMNNTKYFQNEQSINFKDFVPVGIIVCLEMILSKHMVLLSDTNY